MVCVWLLTHLHHLTRFWKDKAVSSHRLQIFRHFLTYCGFATFQGNNPGHWQNWKHPWSLDLLFSCKYLRILWLQLFNKIALQIWDVPKYICNENFNMLEEDTLRLLFKISSFISCSTLRLAHFTHSSEKLHCFQVKTVSEKTHFFWYCQRKIWFLKRIWQW